MGNLPEVRGFEVERRLGSGSMGEVWAARATSDFGSVRSGESAALKLIRRDLLAAPGLKERFEREFTIGLTVQDPHLLKMYGRGETPDGTPFVAMELLAGQGLDVLIRNESPFEEKFALQIAVGVARGLQALHEHGVVHRDLKPANVMVGPGAQVKLMDFGLARMVDPDVQLTQPGMFMGTLRYASPEHFGGVVGPQADIWALGVILYEMLAGFPPFPQENQIELLGAIQSGLPEPLETNNPLVTPRTSQIVLRCLQPHQKERFAEAGELIAAIDGGCGSRLDEFLMSAAKPVARVISEEMAPLPVAQFFQGRQPEIDRALELVNDEEVVGIAITGLRGIGKSALLAEIARRASGLFTDGCVYIDLRREDIGMGRFARRLAARFGVEDDDSLPADLLIKVLKKYSLLVVVDSVEVFQRENWEGLSYFLNLAREVRAGGGFAALPSALIGAGRAIPLESYDLELTEISIDGLSEEQGAELLARIVRDRGPAEWKDVAERRWVSRRLGGHPDLLRMVARQSLAMDYLLVRKQLDDLSGRVSSKIEDVLSWSVDRLSDSGLKLLPYFALFDDLSFNLREFAAAMGVDLFDFEFEKGLEELGSKAGLIRFSPRDKTYSFHTAVHEWVTFSAGKGCERFSVLCDDSLDQAHGRLADFWAGQILEIPRVPKVISDLTPIVKAIRHRTAEGDFKAAISHLRVFKKHIAGHEDMDPFELMFRKDFLGELNEIVRLLEPLADRENDPVNWAYLMQEKAAVAFIGTEGFKKKLDCSQAALEVLDKKTHRLAWSRSRLACSMAMLKQPFGDKLGNAEAAMKEISPILELLTEEDGLHYWVAQHFKAEVLIRLSKTGVENAAELNEEVIEILTRSLDVDTDEIFSFARTATLLDLARALIYRPLGDPAENLARARELIDECDADYKKGGSTISLPWMMFLRGRLSLEQFNKLGVNTLKSGLAYVREARDYCEQQEMLPMLAEMWELEGKLLRALASTGEAPKDLGEQALRKSRDLYREIGLDSQVRRLDEILNSAD